MMLNGKCVDDSAGRVDETRAKFSYRCCNDIVSDLTSRDFQFLDTKSLRIELRIASPTDAALVVASDARLTVEQRSQSIATHAWIASGPFALKQFTSLLDHFRGRRIRRKHSGKCKETRSERKKETLHDRTLGKLPRRKGR